ncbi:MAG: hypothetical protein ABSG70_06990 [Terriglobales bacterium]|jgi:hypothetical protein
MEKTICYYRGGRRQTPPRTLQENLQGSLSPVSASGFVAIRGGPCSSVLAVLSSMVAAQEPPKDATPITQS